MKSELATQEQIIATVGEIYNYLSENGEVSISKLSKDMRAQNKDLNEMFINMGLGWLSREDKLAYTRKPKSTTVKLV